MSEQEYLIETMTTELAKLVLQHQQDKGLQSALTTVYNSETYEKLCDERTRLMYQHPGYVYSYLDNELRTGCLH